MNDTYYGGKFSLCTVLRCFVIMALAMFGGMLGVASGLQETIFELSPENRLDAMGFGLVCGGIPSIVVGVILYRTCRKLSVKWLFVALTAFMFPLIFLFIITARIAAS